MPTFINQARGGCHNLPLYLILFILLYGGLAVIPVDLPLRDVRAFNLAYAMFICIGLYVLSRVNVATGLLILYAGIVSFASFAYVQETFFTLFAFIVLYIGIVHTYPSWKDRKGIIYDFIGYIALVNVAFQVMQYFGFYIISRPMPGTEHMLCGLMNNINDTSALYAVCLPVFLRRKRFILLPIVLLGLYLSATLNGIFASVCVLTVYGLVNVPIKRYLKWVIVAVVVAIPLLASYVLFVDGFDLSSQKRGRLYIWNQTAQVASMKTFGWGFGQYDMMMPLVTSFKYLSPELRKGLFDRVRDKESFDRVMRKASNGKPEYFLSDAMSKTWFVQAHNEYLEWWFIAGWMGVMLLFIALLRCLWCAFRQRDRQPFYGLLAASLTAFFFFSFHIIPIALITVIYLALIEGERHGD